MKISKAGRFILLVGMVFITFASLGIAGAKQISERKQLDDELTIAERRVENLQLEQLTTNQEELVESLDQAIAEITAAEDKLRQSNASINVTAFLFEIALLSGVSIIDMTSSGLSSDDLGDIPCTVQSVTTLAEGEVLDLIAFVTNLNNNFTSGVVRSADIAIPEEAEEKLPTVNIRLSVYTYESE